MSIATNELLQADILKKLESPTTIQAYNGLVEAYAQLEIAAAIRHLATVIEHKRLPG